MPRVLRGPACPHCVDVEQYKVYRGKLYKVPGGEEHFHKEIAEEMLLVVVRKDMMVWCVRCV